MGGQKKKCRRLQILCMLIGRRHTEGIFEVGDWHQEITTRSAARFEIQFIAMASQKYWNRIKFQYNAAVFLRLQTAGI